MGGLAARHRLHVSLAADQSIVGAGRLHAHNASLLLIIQALTSSLEIGCPEFTGFFFLFCSYTVSMERWDRGRGTFPAKAHPAHLINRIHDDRAAGSRGRSAAAK